tara:strand:+ start:103 stop:339 length:237 start_codon:yes stop_codon:yes gene_type:complete
MDSETFNITLIKGFKSPLKHLKTMKNITVRFFIYDYSTEDIVKEVSEKEFLNDDGIIEYERDTVFDNGVRQICLTKVS